MMSRLRPNPRGLVICSHEAVIEAPSQYGALVSRNVCKISVPEACKFISFKGIDEKSWARNAFTNLVLKSGLP